MRLGCDVDPHPICESASCEVQRPSRPFGHVVSLVRFIYLPDQTPTSRPRRARERQGPLFGPWFLLVVAMPFVPSSFLFLVVRPGAPSSIHAPSNVGFLA